jgi:lambda family phage tail tape measure protein
MDTVEGHIKSAFMSMVDGSASVEDAFRNMLRNIILAIYEQQVASKAASTIGDWISAGISALAGAPTSAAPTSSLRPVARPQADGGAWNNGVQFFANGGIVNSPTMFGHSTGLGVMGEAGPEAIMPLKRGANGKLGVQVDGNAGNVTVVQNFNIAANGDESVRRIVRQETPRIAEQAKAAVVDAKRRGGSYGRSF